MGVDAGISLNFASEHKPKDLVHMLLMSGLTLPIYGKIEIIDPKSQDISDWMSINQNVFTLDDFLSQYDDYDIIGIAMAVEGDIGVSMIIYPRSIMLSLSINTVYIQDSDKIPDFSWYISKLICFINSVHVESVECFCHR